MLSQIDSSKTNGLVELQLPLGRLALLEERRERERKENSTSVLETERAEYSVAGQLFSGHDHAMQRKHYLALDKYCHAFNLDSEQPLTALTIGKFAS